MKLNETYCPIIREECRTECMWWIEEVGCAAVSDERQRAEERKRQASYYAKLWEQEVGG